MNNFHPVGWKILNTELSLFVLWSSTIALFHYEVRKKVSKSYILHFLMKKAVLQIKQVITEAHIQEKLSRKCAVRATCQKNGAICAL